MFLWRFNTFHESPTRLPSTRTLTHTFCMTSLLAVLEEMNGHDEETEVDMPPTSSLEATSPASTEEDLDLDLKDVSMRDGERWIFET